jgi:hypothetical protein
MLRRSNAALEACIFALPGAQRQATGPRWGFALKTNTWEGSLRALRGDSLKAVVCVDKVLYSCHISP